MTPSEEPETPPAPEAPRQLHPFTLLFTAIRIARQLIFPALIGGISGADGDAGRLVGWVIGILSVPALAVAALRYVTFRYRLGEEELVIDSGVIRRQHRVIPLQRVQNIDVRESALQRLCGVAELHVETAGSGRGAEASLEVLDRETAEALRAELLARRRALRDVREPRDAREAPADGAEVDAAVGAHDQVPAVVADDLPAVRTLARLDPGRLAAAGATANEAGLIAAGLAAAFQLIDDFALERYLPVMAIQERVESATVAGAIWVLFLVLATLLVLGWIVSVIGSIIGYHDFTLERVGGDLRKRYGLLGRRQTTVPLERVQTLRIEESLLRRPLRLAAMKIETAGGSPREGGRRGAEAFVPIAMAGEVPALVRGVFEDLDVTHVHYRRVHPRSRRRAFLRFTFAGIVVMAAIAVITTVRAGAPPVWLVWWGLPITLVTAWGLAAWQYVHRGFALVPGYVLARAGVLNRITWIVPDHKVQTIHRTSTPFQRRHGLSTLVVDTASGGRQSRIIDLDGEDATWLLEEVAQRTRSRRAKRDARPGDV